MPRVTVLLADDHIIMLQGLRLLLKDSFQIVDMVSDGRALLEAAKQLKPDVIVTEISMPLLNGLDAIGKLKREGVTSKIIVLTMHVSPTLAAQAFKTGASGFLVKRSSGEELIEAIQQAVQGRFYLTPLVTEDTINVLMEASNNDGADEAKLTPRQREVLQLVAEGRTMKEVAGVLHISARTAETHKYEIMQVLQVKTTAQLIQHAVKIGLIMV
jgi:DNA-binding NarL/FixJ family response regulator